MTAGTKYQIIFLLVQLLQSTTSTQSQECRYQYMHQPSPKLDCNPYGTELQLHCGFIGPLSPEFNLVWYSSSATNDHEPPLPLEQADDYTVNNIVLDLKTGHYVRSVSSVLLTGPIGDYHRGRCLWCQAEFYGIAHPLKSNALCIHDESKYLTLDKCRDAVIVNTSLVCANVTEEFMAQVGNKISTDNKRSSAVDNALNNSIQASAVVNSKPESTIDPSPSIMHSNILAKTNDAYKQFPSSISLHTLSMATQTIALPVIPVTPTPIIMNVASATTDTLVTPTDTPRVKTEEEDSKTSEGDLNRTDSGVKSKSEVEGSLYAAIVFCVVFVVIIVFLVTAIVCLSRKKDNCLTVWIRNVKFWKKHKAGTTTDVQGHALVGNTILAGSDMHAMVESGMHGSNSVSYKEETDGSGKFHVIVNVESNVPGPSEAASITSQHGCNGESQQHYEQQLENRKSTYSDEQPLAHSPAPQTEKENEHDSFRDGEARDKADYDHLQPPTAKDDGDIKDEHQYAELEEPIAKRSKTPPKKPPRLLQSREHLYHTLENSDESGLLRSADTSHDGSQLSGMNDYAEANILPTGAFISSQVQEIFDDPRYAAVFVNQDHLEHTHIHDKIEVSRSRSTPSLVAVDIIPFSPSDTGRRSLRVVRQKRPSILNSHFVPHH